MKMTLSVHIHPPFILNPPPFSILHPPSSIRQAGRQAGRQAVMARRERDLVAFTIHLSASPLLRHHSFNINPVKSIIHPLSLSWQKLG